MKRLLIIIVFVVAAALVGSMFLVPRVAKKIVEDAGPRVLGVPIHLADATFNPLTGRIEITGFTLGNPEGFKSKESVGVGRAEVVVNLTSLFGDPLVIERIQVDSPRLTYEVDLGSSNLGRIQENVESKSTAGESGQAPKKQKRVLIRDLLVQDGEIGVSVAALGGKGVTVPLPEIHLTNVGNDTGGADIGMILGQLFGQITAVAEKAATGLVSAAGDAAATAGDATIEGADQVGEAAGKVTDKIGKVLK